MYHLVINSSKHVAYCWVHELPTGKLRVTDFNNYIQVTRKAYRHTYPNLRSFLAMWPAASIFISTKDPSTILQTHPELFL